MSVHFQRSQRSHLQPRKQTEARHAKDLEAAEEKFRKAFDRVKRAAIEAPQQQDRAVSYGNPYVHM